MAERYEVVWSPRAQNDLKEILTYWIRNNRSFTFSEKLLEEILSATALLKQHPLAGKSIDIGDFRRLLVRFYFIVYRIQGNQVRILRIWDGRQKTLLP